MRFIHISDLHIGKRLNEFSLLEDQAYILSCIIGLCGTARADAVIIAGDVYDKSVPSAEAVQLFDDFLSELAKLGLKVFVISGNHDSPERIAFGSRIMRQGGIYMSPVYSADTSAVTLQDEYGDINIYMLPFIKPAHVRRYFPDREINTYTDALRIAVEHMGADMSERNIIITHQFVTGAVRCDSEEISVGGTDNVDVAVFEGFDYVALGHIHRPQQVSRESVRYCGTPLKYSFSEAGDQKSVTLVDIKEKGNMEISALPLVPLRDMKIIRGDFRGLISGQLYPDLPRDSYIQAILTDEEDIPDAMSALQEIYPNLMKLEYDNTRTAAVYHFTGEEKMQTHDPLGLFTEFYRRQNGAPPTEVQTEYMNEIITRIWEGEI